MARVNCKPKTGPSPPGLATAPCPSQDLLQEGSAQVGPESAQPLVLLPARLAVAETGAVVGGGQGRNVRHIPQIAFQAGGDSVGVWPGCGGRPAQEARRIVLSQSCCGYGRPDTDRCQPRATLPATAAAKATAATTIHDV